MKFQRKSTVYEMTNTVGGFDSRLPTWEENFCELEYIQAEIVQNEKYGEKLKRKSEFWDLLQHNIHVFEP